MSLPIKHDSSCLIGRQYVHKQAEAIGKLSIFFIKCISDVIRKSIPNLPRKVLRSIPPFGLK